MLVKAWKGGSGAEMGLLPAKGRARGQGKGENLSREHLASVHLRSPDARNLKGNPPMKVKVTATLTLETEIFPSDYADVEGMNAKNVDEIIEYEIETIVDEPWDSSLGEELLQNGHLSNVKIEKIEDKAEAA
jgi:hypothetical protein